MEKLKTINHKFNFIYTLSGPRLFLSCPMDIAGSQVWFTDLWNYSVVPYIIEAVRDGLQVEWSYFNRWTIFAKTFLPNLPRNFFLFKKLSKFIVSMHNDNDFKELMLDNFFNGHLFY